MSYWIKKSRQDEGCSATWVMDDEREAQRISVNKIPATGWPESTTRLSKNREERRWSASTAEGAIVFARQLLIYWQDMDALHRHRQAKSLCWGKKGLRISQILAAHRSPLSQDGLQIVLYDREKL